MNDNQLQSPAEISAFLAGAQSIKLSIPKQARYSWIAKLLKQMDYYELKKKEKSIVRTYMKKVTGYSDSQLSDLIKQYRSKKWIGARNRNRTRFGTHYTNEDISLLVETDKQHETLSGPLTKKLFERCYKVFNDKKYERLHEISISHIYNLRGSNFYQRKRYCFEKTKPRKSTIGHRRKPQPDGEPGYIRIDTVHQGDKGKRKGVYHINAVDEVTQFEVVCTVERISEQYLIPVLEELLSLFPFKIRGFHSDNGSEYVNYIVEKLLNKLNIEFTKSRPRRSNDNALVESKNGSIVRKILGYTHIPQRYAPSINEFNKKYLFFYLNYHRPCYFSDIETDKRGKEKKTYKYKNIMTPYEKLKSLPNGKDYLKEGVTFEQLELIARKETDLESAKKMRIARKELFSTIFP